ncbi:D-ribose pyranase [Paenibacillus profundus]|uniref:D-ribose pyranase n=1 Tax=Paenibacillus profundus TaxID=1173085 RepID=A0ABS8YLU6_9BACL|nr:MULTISPECIES: D-ribose pyranase [Paenibacillus]MCE5170529.1 D-ribose pyranase [Paenibacillus profundus]MCM3340190.1 D-ribose pyranase [Paenibacillus sp. MER TA 81-3]
MKKGGILHPQLNRILSETGHTDMLTVCDRGFPVPMSVERLDLALCDDIPTVVDVLQAVAGEFIIDCVVITEEMQSFSPERVAELKALLPDVRWKVMAHVEFKQLCQESRAVIRTGDTTPYANLMIVSG